MAPLPFGNGVLVVTQETAQSTVGFAGGRRGYRGRVGAGDEGKDEDKKEANHGDAPWGWDKMGLDRQGQTQRTLGFHGRTFR